MLGSTIINQRQHVGLQKLSALAAVAHSTLGPHKKYKFIQDEATGDSVLASSCLRILDNLDVATCSVGQLVHETIRAHHEIYHTGSGCLLFFAGAWSQTALSCLHQGIPAMHVVAAMIEGIEFCMDLCKKSNISFNKLFALTWNHEKEALMDSKVCRGRRQVKLSRHFYNTKTESIPVQEPRLPDVAHLANRLSHGCDDGMHLVIQASQIQLKATPNSAFDVTKVTTCMLPGLSEDLAHVVPGCVVLLNAEQTSVAHHMKDKPLNVVFILGDLSHTYRHLGLKKHAGVKHVSDQSGLSDLSKEEEWMEKVLRLLLQLQVDLVMVSGLVNELVIQRCSQRRILVVGKVRMFILKEMANAAGAIMVTYATQLSKHCVGKNIQVSIWKEIYCHEGTPLTAVRVNVTGCTRFVTAVITSPVNGKLQALEDRFWACAYRVHHALKDKAVLPGAGTVEMLCILHLKKKAEVQNPRNGISASNPYISIVFNLLADSFTEYLSTVMANSTGISHVNARTALNQKLQDINGISAEFSPLMLDSDESAPSYKVVDNFTVKQESWRRALDLVLLVFQTDAEIITGVDKSKHDSQTDLMFL
ncbi:Bardet-Biedl syndrome 12 protein [Corythoichthys intestinalis]|uniref:Bardet-Biedl syndrome 12 protein n=1 Tax=Corythoichthys intestinalis TaxID=161448 RepID=UPI0025A6225F|nr:Bardet-Biedl syndrome 12 protein [Corythoichthys intestinalis]XP_057706326.1 Bardet-Biedl syndrome 12 protein [Corythoichthys intestinalis]XP_061792792.1 Bardet-Biedl syndrome 12 protein-like [Nerophis lumbriciformis]